MLADLAPVAAVVPAAADTSGTRATRARCLTVWTRVEREVVMRGWKERW